MQFFCYDYFEDLLASIAYGNFCKKFRLSIAGVVSKIFVIENALHYNQKINFCVMSDVF